MEGFGMQEFRELLPELVAQYGGSKAQLAKAIGITPASFSRLTTTMPSADVCLRLAAVTHANPSVILRAAGRGDVATLLEGLYGHAATRARSAHKPSDEAFLMALKKVPKDRKRAIWLLIELAIHPAAGSKR
jgi:hypothetical protein